MGKYAVTRNNITPTLNQDVATLVSASNRKTKLTMIEVSGKGTTGSNGAFQIARSSGGSGGGTPITPELRETDQAASVTTVNTAWSSQPTIDDAVALIGLNVNGGINRLGPIEVGPGIIEARNGAYISIRCVQAPSSAIDLTLWFED